MDVDEVGQFNSSQIIFEAYTVPYQPKKNLKKIHKIEQQLGKFRHQLKF